MRADDLDLKELLELDADGGVIRFAKQRVLLLDAVAMGLLRNYLIENLGLNAARTVLTRFGFAHGWRMADALRTEFTWDTDLDWKRAGTHLHALQGLFRVEPGSAGPLAKEGVTLVSSYEAEQHLLHFGRSDFPVCWTLCGLTSGYLSRCAGEEIFVLEDRCVSEGMLRAISWGAHAKRGGTSATTSCASSRQNASRSRSMSHSSVSRRH